MSSVGRGKRRKQEQDDKLEEKPKQEIDYHAESAEPKILLTKLEEASSQAEKLWRLRIWSS
jgi:hypothetical protein